MPTSPVAGLPRADGRVDVRVTDWQGLAALLPGARMNGEAALSLELQSSQKASAADAPSAQPPQAGATAARQSDSLASGSDRESAPQAAPAAGPKIVQNPGEWTQRAVLRWNVPRFSYRAGESPAVDLRGLEGEAALDDAFGKGLLAARLRLAAARRGEMTLGANVRVSGSVCAGLDVALETTGLAASRCNVHWQPGKVELQRLDVSLPAQKLGLHGGSARRFRSLGRPRK